MGPLMHTHKGKDGIDYNIRWIPIGGYVAMAGEVYDDDDKIPKDRLLCNRPWWQRLIILCAGVTNNFIMAIVLLTVYAAIWGGGVIEPKIDYVTEDSAAAKAGMKANDTILKINDYKIKNWDKAQIVLYFKDKDGIYTFEVKHENGEIEKLDVKPDMVKDEETGEETRLFGIGMQTANTESALNVIKYGFKKFGSVISSMYWTIYGLVSGKISLDALSGPVGIYEVVGASFTLSVGYAIEYLVYIIAYLSVNVGFINILPFPAFDGYRAVITIIEKIIGKKVNQKVDIK